MTWQDWLPFALLGLMALWVVVAAILNGRSTVKALDKLAKVKPLFEEEDDDGVR